ncbi:general odorant-binding protein 83a isoform X3 [Aethina tumida]|nr:general odorant-binding protein 83a isoform X3 [Aethina tumida]
MSLIKAMPEEMRELAEMLHNTCVTETGVDEDIVTNAINGDFSTDESFKSYLKCLMDQMACISDDGNVDVEAIIALIPENIRDKAAPIIRKCGSEKPAARLLDTIWNFHICCLNTDPTTYFLF